MEPLSILNHPQCSKECGNGTTTREVVCVVFLSGTFRATLDIECNPDSRPNSTQPCNPDVCPPHWYYTDWSQVCGCFSVFLFYYFGYRFLFGLGCCSFTMGMLLETFLYWIHVIAGIAWVTPIINHFLYVILYFKENEIFMRN